MDSLTDLASVFARLNDCHFSIVDGRMESFAFYALNDDRQVAVRIGLLNSCLSDNEVRQLGLLLPVPPSLESDLMAAAQGRHGFLMRASPKLFGGDPLVQSGDPRHCRARVRARAGVTGPVAAGTTVALG